MKFFITGSKRGLGYALKEKYGNTESLDECDIFINCKHDGFLQVELLYEAASKNKRIINIGSVGSDWINGYKKFYKYGIEKKVLKDANEQLFYDGINTTIINFGFLDTESVSHIKRPKIDLDYAVSIIDWIIFQPYKIKEISITP